MNFEDSAEAGDLKQIVDAFCQVKEFDVPALLSSRGIDPNQCRQARAVNVIDFRKIQNDARVSGRDELLHLLAQGARFLAQRYLAADIEHQHIPG